MPFASKQQQEEARAINTFDYLQAKYPGMLEKADGEWRWTEHHSLVVTPSNGKWHWINAGFGGTNPVDFEEKVNGVPFPKSVFSVLDMKPAARLQQQTRQREPEPPRKKDAVFELPHRCRNNEDAIKYLQGRGIDLEIINRCIAAGSIYESVTPIYEKGADGRLHPKLGRSGREMVIHNCTFVGFGPAGDAKFACSRGMVGSFKQDIDGSAKEYNFVVPAKDPACKNLVVNEAAIDSLSDATLKKYQGQPWDDFHYLSSSGTSPLALLQFLKDHPGIENVYFGLDYDAAGLMGVKKMMLAVLSDPTLMKRVQILMPDLPPPGMDKNEHLQSLVSAKDSWASLKKTQVARAGRSEQTEPARATR